jgi:formylglycine-generating enzyme required for sulfatase activity
MNSISTLACLLVFAGFVSARADVFNMQPSQTNLQFVTIGDPGNSATTRNGSGALDRGSVSYAYRIGTYDVTTAQYTQFLNAVAATDTYSLYNPNMASVPTSFLNAGCGIVRSGSPGSFTYSFAADHANFPVNYVNWGDAARFVNWLQHGQLAGAQGPGTTETGVYTLNGAMTFQALLSVPSRSVAATYFLPNEDEWYKAAFYKGGGINAGYWTYATRSDSAPSNLLSTIGTNNINYLTTVYTDPTNFLTPVGTFQGSPGPYGTFDQGGDVYQWTETSTSSYRILRGSDFGDGLQFADSFTYKVFGDPTSENDATGIRIAATVPEPNTFALASIGVTCIFACFGAIAGLRNAAQGASS